MSTYYSSKRQFQTYGAYRAKLVIETSQTATTFRVNWHIYVQMQYAWGVGVGIQLSIGGDKEASRSGALSRSEGGSDNWKTAASVSGHKIFDKKTSSRKVKFVAKAYGTSIKGHGAADNGSVSVDHSVTIPALDTYTIRYNDNGGSGGPANQTKYHGIAINLRTGRPSRTGYTFVGWGLSSGDDRKNYDPGDRYTANRSDTLYAIWKKNSWTVSYKANGGRNTGPTSQTKVYNKTLKLFEGGYFSRTGYNLIGWATSSKGSVAYRLGGSYTKNADEVLYAVWKGKTYTISYKLNGGESYHRNQSKVQGESVKLYADAPKRTNYKFLYWEGSDGKKYKPGDTYSHNGNITLTATWELNVNTMIVWQIDARSGEYVKTQQKLTIGKNYTYTLPDIPNTYGFIGWSKNKEAIQPYTISDTAFSKKITVPAGNVDPSQRTLYAVYKDITLSKIRILNTQAIRVNSTLPTESSTGTLTSDFTDYISAIDEHESYPASLDDAWVIFGNIELSSSSTQISTVNITLKNYASTIVNSKLGNRIYFYCFLSDNNKFSLNSIYNFDVKLIDYQGKPLITNIEVQKIASIFDITTNHLKTSSEATGSAIPNVEYDLYPITLGPGVKLVGTSVNEEKFYNSDIKSRGGDKINLISLSNRNEVLFGGYTVGANNEDLFGSTYIYSPPNKNINLGSSSHNSKNINVYGQLKARKDIYASNNIYVKNHDTSIGWYKTGSRTGISVGTGTSYNAFNLIDNKTTLHLSPGVYILHASVHFPASSNTATSRRGIALGYTSAAYSSMNVENGVTSVSRLESVCMFAPTTNKSVFIYLFQNSGATIQNCNIYWRVVRII